MDSTGMMKMASGDGIPLRQGARTGSQLVFGGCRGLRWQNSRCRLFSGGFCIYRNFWRRSHVRGGLRIVHEIGPTPSRVGRPLLSRGLLEDLLTWTPSLQDHILPKNDAAEGFVPFGLRLIFLFFEILKQAIKQQYGLVPKII